MPHVRVFRRRRLQQAFTALCPVGWTGLGAALVVMQLALVPSLSAETVTYRLVVDNTWSQETHPGKMPPERAHFSWLGGGTHNDQVSFWEEGQVASPPMVQMAETGVIDMLADEVRSQVGQGKAFGVLAWRWWVCAEGIVNDSCGGNVFEFEVDSDFPLVTLVTMLGPSPDWFVGVSGLNLRDGDRWRGQVVVDLHPYDGGTRSANQWPLGGPQNDPPEPISLITEESGQLVGPDKMGTMTFTLLASDDGYPPDTLVPAVDLGLQPTLVQVPEAFRGEVPDDLTLNLPPGFSASVFAYQGLRQPRFMAFDEGGVLHVANMGRDQIVAFPDRDKDGVADERIVGLGGLEEAHSLVFYKGYLYVAEEHQVIRVRDTDGDLVYEDREVILPDIPWDGWHDTRTLVVDRINDKMYVSVGSPCDLCRMEEGLQMVGNSDNPVSYHPERGTVVEFNPDGSGRRIFATGVRNVIGMDFHPVTNELWGNNNGHDLEGRTKPPEWVDIIRDQDFMGYPFVHSYQVLNDFDIDEYQRVLPITQADRDLIARQKRPVALVPAHYAPMGIHFYTGNQFPQRYQNAALVAFRAGKAKLSSHPGYMVSAIFSDADGSNARMGSFITGFQTGTSQDDVWGFPVGLATDAEGSLYITSDNRNNLILKITHSLISGTWEHNLPDDLSHGAALEVSATVQIERLDPDGGTPRVTADLSAFGGPAAVALEPLGGDAYRLDTRLETAGLPTGIYRLAVRLEQDIRGTARSFDFFKIINLLPQDLAVLDEELASTWQLQGLDGAQVVDAGAGPIYHGIYAAGINAEPPDRFGFWKLEFTPEQPIERMGFAGLRFAFHPGDAELPRIPRLFVVIDGLSVDLLGEAEGIKLDIDRRDWQVVEVPFEAFDQINFYGEGLRDQVDFVDLVRIEGNLTGTFYLDDVRLVTRIPSGPPPPTAVLEAHDETTPNEFALERNYPNPFNSDTVIRFALPQAADIELAVYNLAGQQVARLVRGQRPAGRYTINWDGRNDQGEGLATGVYIYRLRAGDLVRSHKLLLLR